MLLLLGLLGLPRLSYPSTGDQGEYATIAQQMLAGHTLYVQTWNPKPPGIIFIYAALFVMGGPNTLMIGLLDVIIALLTAALLFVLARRMYDTRLGLLAAAVYGITYFSYDNFTVAEADALMNLPLVATIYCALRGRQGGQQRWLFFAGLSLGFAFALKYTALALALPLLFILWQGGKSRFRILLSMVGYIALGFILVTGMWVGYIITNGAWDEYYRTFSINAGYTAFGYGGTFIDVVELLLGDLFLFHIGSWILIAIALISQVRYWHSPDNSTISLRTLVLLLWSWLAILFMVLIVQGKFYPYHWLPMLPPMSILTAIGFFAVLDWPGWHEWLPSLSNRWKQGMLIVLMLFAVGAQLVKRTVTIYPQFIAYSRGALARDDYLRNFGGFGGSRGQSALAKQMIANYIDAHTRPDEYIVAWGYVPDLYLLTQRPPVSRFYYSYPLVAPWCPPEWQDEFITDMHVTPPTYFVVDHLDSFPFLTGRREDAAGQLRYFPALKEELLANYELETNIEDFSLFRRKQGVR